MHPPLSSTERLGRLDRGGVSVWLSDCTRCGLSIGLGKMSFCAALRSFNLLFATCDLVRYLEARTCLFYGLSGPGHESIYLSEARSSNCGKLTHCAESHVRSAVTCLEYERSRDISTDGNIRKKYYTDCIHRLRHKF